MAQTVTVYRSTDASAPTLNATAGSLISVLDGCLVNGYGTQTAAGWTKPFSGTNTASYLTSGTPNAYLFVNDNATGNGLSNGTTAAIRGYEVQTGATDTGTGPFPTTTQATNGLYVRKSTTGNAQAWVVVASNNFFHLLIETNDTTNRYIGNFFGKINSYVSSDNFGFIICGSTTVNSGTTSSYQVTTTQFSSPVAGHYLMRAYTGTAGAITCGKMSENLLINGSTSIGSNTGSTLFPYPADGGLYASPLYISESTPVIRGTIPGIWAPMHGQPLGNNHVVTGNTDFSGITLESFWITSSTVGDVLIETSSTW